MCLELPSFDVATIKANCGPGIENYHICDRHYVTESQDVVKLIFLFWFMVLENLHVCDRCFITKSQDVV